MIAGPAQLCLEALHAWSGKHCQKQNFCIAGYFCMNLRLLNKGASLGVVFMSILLSACGTTINSYESPNYTVSLDEGPYQIREYPNTIVASTTGNSSDSGFRKIYSYISGNNSSSEKISMTVPVRTQDSGGSKTIAFFMPKKHSREMLPAPSTNDVKIEELRGGTFAALRFSGRTPEPSVVGRRAELAHWASARGFQVLEEWYLDRYDPPWTLPFLRTNEVLVRVIKGEEKAVE